jgi:hypothetical protein
LGGVAAQSINAGGGMVKRASAPPRRCAASICNTILTFANKLFSLRQQGTQSFSVHRFALVERKTMHNKDRKYRSAEGKEAFAIPALRI